MNEFITSHLFLAESGIPIVKGMLDNKQLAKVDQPSSFEVSYHNGKIHSTKVDLASLGNAEYNPFSELPPDSVVIIPIVGLMQKYTGYDSSWRWSIGMDYYAGLIRQACTSDNISGIILTVNSPGGTTTSLMQLEDALRNRTKPCVALVDGICMSAAMYAASFCDKIYAVNAMCQVGSIGVMTTIVDDSKMNEKYGYVVRAIYPPESKWKNKAYRDAIDGEDDTMIKEDLTPLALHFQNIIKTNRKKIDLTAEGILEGREFYAQDAIKYKLIDGMGTISTAVEYIGSINEVRTGISRIF